MVAVVVFAFVVLSALLVASGSNLIMELSGALDALFEASRAPHFVQMHAGEIDRTEIDEWAAANEMVEEQQTMEMVTVDGSALYVGSAETPETNTIMDVSFVSQNPQFDFLLDLDNQVIEVAPGEVAVPIYYRERDGLRLGDTIRVADGGFDRSFRVAAFVRDAQMNPAIVHSKRFLVHEKDLSALHEHFAETEYLIEFRLRDPGQAGAFGEAYASSGLPKKGTSVDRNLFMTLNGLSDGIVAGVVIVLSLLLMVIAILCLRFTILATMEEDVKEIGVMKAIGVGRRDIGRIYLTKYVVIGVVGSTAGYLASLYLNPLLSANVMLYMGQAHKGILGWAVPMLAAGGMGLMVVISCAIILRRLRQITAVEALHSGDLRRPAGHLQVLSLRNSGPFGVNVFLGLRDVLQRYRLFGLLCFVFLFCAFVIIVPVHFLTTIQSPSFISYMGIGQSDMRIDLRQSDDMAQRFERLLAYVESDPDVDKYSPLVTAQFTMVGDDGAEETLSIQTGDFSIFPLDYVEGKAPQLRNEMALSSLNAREMDKGVGHRLVLIVDGQKREMRVSGIYQDVTNGGRTAKAVLPYDPEKVLWRAVSLDVTEGSSIDAKVQEYAETFHPARVTDLEGYLSQTLGNTIAQLRKVTVVAVGVGLCVAALITSLFLTMLISKDSSQIAIMRSMGFSLRDIRVQYLSRALLLLGLGIALGTVFSNTLGQRLVSSLWALMGASQIRFVIDPIRAYVLLPSFLMLAVSLTTLLSIRGIKETNIAEMIVE